MSIVTLNPAAGEVWVQVKVEADHPCAWAFAMTPLPGGPITLGIPPMQNGPDQRPLAQPGPLIDSAGSTWVLIITNLSTTVGLSYAARVRLFQVAETGDQVDVYNWPADDPTAPEMPDTIDAQDATANPRTHQRHLIFML